MICPCTQSCKNILARCPSPHSASSYYVRMYHIHMREPNHHILRITTMYFFAAPSYGCYIATPAVHCTSPRNAAPRRCAATGTITQNKLPTTWYTYIRTYQTWHRVHVCWPPNFWTLNIVVARMSCEETFMKVG